MGLFIWYLASMAPPTQPSPELRYPCDGSLPRQDLEQRDLGADTRAAILSLGDIKARIGRRILQEILERCMFLMYWTTRHNHIAMETSWDDLLRRAVSTILSLKIDQHVKQRLSGPCI